MHTSGGSVEFHKGCEECAACDSICQQINISVKHLGLYKVDSYFPHQNQFAFPFALEYICTCEVCLACIPVVEEQEVILQPKLAEGLFAFELMTPVCLELFYINPCPNECRFEFYICSSFHCPQSEPLLKP